MQDQLIRAVSLSKCYHLYDKPADRLKQALWRGRRTFHRNFWPLRDISFSVARGEVIGVLGANGSGKSTLLQLVSGILQPTSGVLEVTGRIAALLELGSGFNPEFNGRENVFLNAALLGLSRAETQERYRAIVDFAGIGEFIDQPVKNYSSGMVVRLAFAVSSFVDADLLIVDEALAVGDVAFQARCLERMERLMARGTTILLVSHDMQTIRRYCDRVLYLNQGTLVFDGDTEEGTELYLRDARERTPSEELLSRRWDSDGGTRLGFTTVNGSIESVTWVDNPESPSAVFHQGETASLVVRAKISDEVLQPRIQITVRDTRGYNLYGYSNHFAGVQLQRDAEGYISVRFSFATRLQLGRFTVTVRLDDRHSEHDIRLLDKQVGMLDFEVIGKERVFDAVVDLSGVCEDGL